MSHILDPKRLPDDRAYCAARDELLALAQEDVDTPAPWRFYELSLLIREYESARRGAATTAAGDSR